MAAWKQAVRRLLVNYGIVVRRPGFKSAISGADWLRDAAALVATDSPRAFDIGANEGQTIDALWRAFLHPRITAFEPSPRTVATLQQTHGARATIEPIALSDTPGEAQFFVLPQNVYDSLLPTSRFDGSGNEAMTVPVDTIDRYCQAHQIETLDVLKVDAQGADLRVLQGASDLLRRRAARVVVAEAMIDRLYEGQATLVELLSYMSGHGYDFLGTYGQTYAYDRLSHCDLMWTAPR
jgi:FkbM family methyltransferase